MQPPADMWSFGTLLRIMLNCSLEAAHPGLDCGEYRKGEEWSFGTLLRIMISCSLEAAYPGLDRGE